MHKHKVAFICVHNSCRSQMAEALTRMAASDRFECFSAGTELKTEIDRGAVQAIKKRFNIDMTECQYPKLISELPEVDIVITMGCNVECPALPCSYREDWGLTDPSGLGQEQYDKVIDEILVKIENLKKVK